MAGREGRKEGREVVNWTCLPAGVGSVPVRFGSVRYGGWCVLQFRAGGTGQDYTRGAGRVCVALDTARRDRDMSENKSVGMVPSGSWLFNDQAFGQRLPRSKSMLKSSELLNMLPSTVSSTDRLVHGRRPVPSASQRPRKKRKPGESKRLGLAATTDGINVRVGEEGYRSGDDEEDRLYARLGLDPADEELIRRSKERNSRDDSKPEEIKRQREIAWEKFQKERQAKAKAAALKGRLAADAKFDSIKAKEEAEAAARKAVEDELKAERIAARRAEERAAKAEVAAQMGMTLEEMEAMEDSAQAGTDEIIAQYKEAFKRIDTDGSGCLSPDELRELVHELGDNVSPTELEAMIAEADKDGDGEIDEEEFIHMMQARLRVDMLAKSMTKSNVRTPTPQTDHQLHPGDRESGEGIEYYSLGTHKFPLSGPSLPPLQIGRALASKRNIMRAGRRGVVDQYYSRPTPHVLKVGAEASADDLRIQLGRAQRIVKKLDEKVQEGIDWVQANCPVTNIRAQQYCQKHGLEKLESLFNRIAYQKLIAVFRKWTECVDYEKNQEKVGNYMKWKGSRRLIKMVQEWDLKQLMSGYDKWHHTVQHLRLVEHGKAATKIQRIARGFLARRRVGRMRKNFAAVQIQRVGRGMIGRIYARGKSWERKRHRAACVIQNRWRGYEGRQFAKVIAKKKRELAAAECIQRAWRGYISRGIASVIRQQRKEHQMACRIQNLWRTRVARRLVSTMRAAIAEEEAALYIQTWWRGILGAREGKARIMARRRIILRETSAMKIQGAWRCFLAREKVYHRRLESAALRVQCAWRARSGRMAYHLKKQAKAQIEREEREAAEKVAAMVREQQALQRIKEQEEQEQASLKIQNRFRIKAAKKDLASRREAARQHKMSAEQRALETKMALRIQCAWRGRKGRLGAHLKMQARREVEREEREAALKIQTTFRGKQGRNAFNAKRQAENEKAAQARIKAEREEEEKAATLMQASWRGHEARAQVEAKVAQKRARELLEEKDRHEQEMAAAKIQARFRGHEARKAAQDKKAAAMRAAMKAQQEQKQREDEIAAHKMQLQMARMQHEKELEEQKRRHEEELLKEKDLVKRKAMQEKQEREMAALKIQQLYRRREARKDLHRRKAKHDDALKKANEEALQRRRELAACKIQTCMRTFLAKKRMKEKVKAREEKLAAMKAAELKKIEDEQKALKLQEQMAAEAAKSDARAKLEAEKKRLEEEAAEKEEQEAAALKMQAVIRGRAAKLEVDEKRRQHAIEMEELKKKKGHEKELAALREKQEQELAAMKLQSLYRGRKARQEMIKFREIRKKEMKLKSRELDRQIAATKIQGMYRIWKARKAVRARKATLQQRWDVSKSVNSTQPLKSTGILTKINDAHYFFPLTSCVCVRILSLAALLHLPRSLLLNWLFNSTL